jgi:hypothetical protein
MGLRSNVVFETAGERKRKRQLAEDAAAAKAAAAPKPQYDVGSTSHGLIKRLGRMEELEKDGASAQSKQNKRDLWAKLADESKRKGR